MTKHSPWLILLMVAPSASLVSGVAGFACGTAVAADQSEKESDSAPLSVPPLDHVEYPEHRPDWIESSVDIDDKQATIVVISGPSDSAEESLAELRMIQRAAVETFVVSLTGASEPDDFYVISDEEIDRRLVTRRYEGEVLQGNATRYEHAAELHFDPSLREAILQAKDNVQVRERLGALGVLTLGGLVTLIGSSAGLGFVLRRSSRVQAETEN